MVREVIGRRAREHTNNQDNNSLHLMISTFNHDTLVYLRNPSWVKAGWTITCNFARHLIFSNCED